MSLPKSVTGLAGIKDFLTWKRAVERYLEQLNFRISAVGAATASVPAPMAAALTALSVPDGAVILWLGDETPDGWQAVDAAALGLPDPGRARYLIRGDTADSMTDNDRST